MNRFLSLLLAGLMASVSAFTAFESADAASHRYRRHGHHGYVCNRRNHPRSYRRVNRSRYQHRRYYRHNGNYSRYRYDPHGYRIRVLHHVPRRLHY